MEQFNDIEIYEQDLNGDGKLAILIGGLNQDNPKAIYGCCRFKIC